MKNFIVIIPFYNRINNLKYNLSICKENNIPVHLLIDFPKKDKDFNKNYFIHRKTIDLLKEFSYISTKIASTNRGKVLFLLEEGFKLIKDYKFIVVVEDDYLITKKFLSYLDIVIKEENIMLATGQNLFNEHMSSLYSKTLISLPLGVSIYNTNYIPLFSKQQLTITQECIPTFLDNNFRLKLFSELIKLYPYTYSTYTMPTGEVVEMYDRSMELKIFFYNLINKIYTFIPKENLTPHNPSDEEKNIKFYTKGLSYPEKYVYLNYEEGDDIFRFYKLYEFLISNKEAS